MSINERPIFVTGGTGKTGSRVVGRLHRLGQPVRIGSRTAPPAFDWERRETWETALAGTAAVYIAYQPDLAAPGAIDVVAEFTRAAVESGVTRAVLLSGRGEPEAEAVEHAVLAASWDATVIRASWFQQNFSENFFVDDIRRGMLVVPEGLAPEPFVDVEDIAEIAALALTADGHAGQIYEVSGPEALTFSDVAQHIAAASKMSIDVQTVPLGAYRDALTGAGLPMAVVELLTYLFTTVLDGRNTPLADGVARALGRPPGSFSAFAERTASAGIWQ